MTRLSWNEEIYLVTRDGATQNTKTRCLCILCYITNRPDTRRTVLEKGGTQNGNFLKTLFQRKRGKLDGLAALTEVDNDTKLLYQELDQRLEHLRAEGVVDVKMLAGRSSSTRDKLWVLNNVLRLSEEGHGSVTVVLPDETTPYFRGFFKPSKGWCHDCHYLGPDQCSRQRHRPGLFILIIRKLDQRRVILTNISNML